MMLLSSNSVTCITRFLWCTTRTTTIAFWSHNRFTTKGMLFRKKNKVSISLLKLKRDDVVALLFLVSEFLVADF